MKKDLSTTSNKSGVAKLVLIVVVSIVLITEAWLGFGIHVLSEEQKRYKLDYAFVNSAGYGLFAVDSWRDQLVSAAKDEAEEFRLTPEQKKELRNEIQQ